MPEMIERRVFHTGTGDLIGQYPWGLLVEPGDILVQVDAAAEQKRQHQDHARDDDASHPAALNRRTPATST